MGVALPQGDMKQAYDTISADNYMGWRSCTMQEAQEAADRGVAAIGISEDRIVVLSANDEEQSVTQTASVMTLDENTSAYAVEGMRYYSYSYGTTTCPITLQQKLNILVSWAEGAEGKNLLECGEYFELEDKDILKDGWCACFVRHCGIKAGLDFGNSNVPTGLRGLLGNLDFTETNKPKVGDLAFIIPEKHAVIGHIGIVVSIENGKIYTIEGNMSGSTFTSIVKRANYRYSDGIGPGWGKIAKFGKNS